MIYEEIRLNDIIKRVKVGLEAQAVYYSDVNNEFYDSFVIKNESVIHMNDNERKEFFKFVKSEIIEYNELNFKGVQEEMEWYVNNHKDFKPYSIETKNQIIENLVNYFKEIYFCNLYGIIEFIGDY